MQSRKLASGATLAVAFALAGCSGSLLESKKIDYKSAAATATRPTLEVPPDLTAPTADDRYAVPDVSPKGTATYSAYSAERAGQTAAPGATSAKPAVAPQSADKMRIERSGTQRWLVVSGSADKLWPQLREFWQENGFILNVASSAGIVSAPNMGPYNVTKAGVIALSETLFTELAKDNVQVTALCPTFFRANIHKSKRSYGGGTDKATDKLVTEAKWSAEEIATHAIEGLLAGKLYVLPQQDAKLTWRMKRLLGQGFYDMLGAAARRGTLDKALGTKK